MFNSELLIVHTLKDGTHAVHPVRYPDYSGKWDDLVMAARDEVRKQEAADPGGVIAAVLKLQPGQPSLTKVFSPHEWRAAS